MHITAETFTTSQPVTGVVEPVYEYMTSEQRQALPAGANPPQATDDNGRPLVEVEFMQTFTEYGRRRTEVFRVRVPESPEVLAIQPGSVTFVNLAVDVRVNKAGKLAAYWAAEGIAAPARAARGE